MPISPEDDVVREASREEVPTVDRLSAALGARYVIERELGRGGMATVYLARDSRHRRPVAVKVLHPELSAALGAERFLKEIELTASLQHPHILPLFDSGAAAGGLLYYVMPYVEGETLRARLEREQQLPVGDAIRIATEVADALDYAHGLGVVHRDIKPENVLLRSGHALVADFGIALAVQQAGGARMTQTGLSLGTPQYMAPEQAMGERAITARADIYALGVVTYEMLAAEPPFTGPTVQAVVARVMTEEPRSLTLQRPSVPPHVDAAVRTALAKIPADRFPSAALFAAALATPSSTPGVGARQAGTQDSAARRTFGLKGMLAAAVLVAGALAAGVAIGRSTRQQSVTREPVRFAIMPDSGTLSRTNPAISPDGRTVVYGAEGPNGARLYVRGMNEFTSRMLAGTDDAEAPFFSPDGAWVGFYSRGAIRKVRLDGSGAAAVTEVPAPAVFSSASWGQDDTIRFAVGTKELHRVAAAGGAATTLGLQGLDARIYTAHPLPGGRTALVTVSHGWNGAELGVMDLASGHVRQLAPGFAPRYAEGYVLFTNYDGDLFRQAFDLDRAQLTGKPERLLSDVHFPRAIWGGVPSYDVSANGTLVYHLGFTMVGQMRLMDREGREIQRVPAESPWTPRFSPDGRRIMYGAFAPGHIRADIWVTDLAAGTTLRVTTDGNDADNNDPVWSPDGRSIVYSAVQDSTIKDVFARALDGGAARRLTRRPGNEWPSDWGTDGNIVVTHVAPGGEVDIIIQPADGSAARPYLATPAEESGARLSPDGRWVSYNSNETGRTEVYVQSYPTPGRKTLVSSRGGANASWRRDGRELYYWQGDQLIAAEVGSGEAGEPPVVRRRSPLFSVPYVDNVHSNYDVSPDGTRFVVIVGRERSNRLVVAVDVLSAESVSAAERK